MKIRRKERFRTALLWFVFCVGFWFLLPHLWAWSGFGLTVLSIFKLSNKTKRRAYHYYKDSKRRTRRRATGKIIQISSTEVEACLYNANSRALGAAYGFCFVICWQFPWLLSFGAGAFVIFIAFKFVKSYERNF